MQITDFLPILNDCNLFNSINTSDIPHLLNCLNPSLKQLSTGDILFSLGDSIDNIGVVLDGSLEIIKENISGSRTILSFLSPPQLFAEGIVCTSHRLSPITVRARSNSTVLLIPYHQVIHSCGTSCHFHSQLIHNMLRILGDKNYYLNTKLDLLLLKGIQEKLITYLLQESKRQNSNSFKITPNRTELADFLNISRPSMCRELATLKQEQLLDYYQSSFKLLDIPSLQRKLLK
ncbi:MAG: Crp/Fnr family transcriptional regulator [Cellulosilyticaceae bacterium]